MIYFAVCQDSNQILWWGINYKVMGMNGNKKAASFFNTVTKSFASRGSSGKGKSNGILLNF